MNKITISGLRLEAFIGIYDYEKNQKQPLELDIFLITPQILAASKSDNIDDALNYEKIIHQIIEWVNQTKFHLIEKLARYIAEKLFDNFPIQQVYLDLKKFPKNLPVEHVSVEIKYPG